MIIIGTPRNDEIDQYIMVDGELAFRLHQAGFIPKYNDEGCLYFKKNKKIQKYLEQLEQKNVRR